MDYHKLEPIKKFEQSLISRLRTYFFGGVLITVPVVISFYIALEFLGWVDDHIVPMIPKPYSPKTNLPIDIPGIGLIIVILGFILIGFLTTNMVGRFLTRFIESIVLHTPFVKTIYSTLKQIFKTVFSNQSEAFRKVVLVEYPTPGHWAIGFLTGETNTHIKDVLGKNYIGVLMPTAPNPMTGFLMFVPKDKIRPLDMTVEEGFKMVISCGLVKNDPILEPAFLTPKKQRRKKKK